MYIIAPLLQGSVRNRSACPCVFSLKPYACVFYIQATALITKEKCSLHIPYCCLTECKRDSNGDWSYGLHMNQDFLSIQQEKSDADKQRELWGLDEQNA